MHNLALSDPQLFYFPNSGRSKRNYLQARFVERIPGSPKNPQMIWRIRRKIKCGWHPAPHGWPYQPCGFHTTH